MTKVQKRELARLSEVIKQTMVHIAFMNVTKIMYDGDLASKNAPAYMYEDTSDNDVDVAFNALCYAFPAFASITDTDTRNLAKCEIDEVITIALLQRKNDPNFNCMKYIESTITAEEVIEDIIAMFEDE